MRTARLVRLIARLFLLILASTMSLISFLGGYSALLILGDEDNIDLDVDFSTGGLLDPPPALFDASEFEIKVDFKIYNEGYFDLEDLRIEMELWMIYHEDVGGDGYAEPIPVKIYQGDKSFSTIEAGKEKENHIKIDYFDLISIDWLHIINNADRDQNIYFEAYNIEISAKYSLGLIAFRVEIDKMELEDYDIPT